MDATRYQTIPPRCPSCGAPLAGVTQRVAPARVGPAPLEPAAPRNRHPVPLGTVGAWLAAAGPQTLLAAGGVLLLAVAALVFTAVAWDDLPAMTRGGLLLGASGASGLLTRGLTRRGVQRTAEATATLTVALLAVLVHGLWRAGVLDGLISGTTLFVVGAGGLAGVSHLLARLTVTGSPRVLAAGLAPTAVVAGGLRLTEALPPLRSTHLEEVVLLAALLAAAIVAAGYAEGALAALPRWRLVTQTAASAPWGLSVVGAAIVLANLAPSASGGDAAVFGGGLLLVIAGGCTAAAARRLGSAAWWDALGTAGVWFAGTLGVAGALQDRAAWWPQLPVVAAAALGAAALWAQHPRRRRSAAVGMTPLLAVAAVGVLETVGWLVDVAVRVVASPWPATPPSTSPAPTVTTMLSALAVVGIVAMIAKALDHAAAVIAALGLGVSVAIAAGTALRPVTGGVVVALVIAAAAVRRDSAPGRWLAMLIAANLAAVALALVDPGWTIATLAFAAALTLAAVRAGGPPVTGMATADLLGLVAAVVAATTDARGATGLAACVGAAAAWMVAATVRARPAIAVPIELAGSAAFAVGIVTAATARTAVWLAVALAVLAVVAAGVATWRPDRRMLRRVAAAAATASSWTVLADLGVEVVEAFTVPPAVLLLVVAAIALRSEPASSSWPVMGAGAGLLTTPTLAQVVADPGDLPRLAATVVIGSLLAVVGRRWRLQAPLATGVTAVVVAALTQHDVVSDVLPRWLLLAAGGVLLLWLSVSYERQRLRLAAARRHLAAMR